MPETITSEVAKPRSETFNPFDLSALIAAYDEPPETEKKEEPESEVKPAPKTEAKPGDKPAEEPKPVVEKPKHAKLAIRLAREAGLSDEEIDGLDPDSLDDEVYTRTVRMRYAPKPAPKEEPKTEEDDFGGLDVSDIHEPIVEVMRALAKRVKAAESHAQRSQQAAQQANTLSFAEKMRALFEGNAAVFGKGPNPNPATKEGARRAAVLGHLSGLLAQKKATTMEADFASACELLGFAAIPPAEKVPAEPDPAVEKWNKGALGRPTDRKADDLPKGEERAARFLRQALESGSKGREVNGEARLEDFPT